MNSELQQYGPLTHREYTAALDLVLRSQTASPAMLAKAIPTEIYRAVQLMKELEAAGVVSQAPRQGLRSVLFRADQEPAASAALRDHVDASAKARQ